MKKIKFLNALDVSTDYLLGNFINDSEGNQLVYGIKEILDYQLYNIKGISGIDWNIIKKYYDENGNEIKKRGGCLKTVLIVIGAIVLLGIVIGALNGGDDSASNDPQTEENANQKEADKENSSSSDESQEEKSSNEEYDVPREHKNALREAQNYVDNMPFSEAGLYQQLTSEYGGQYPEEAAQYALENVDVDYNKEAVEAAESYQENTPMSDSALYDQLVSEYGSQFTPEQAEYAISQLSE